MVMGIVTFDPAHILPNHLSDASQTVSLYIQNKPASLGRKSKLKTFCTTTLNIIVDIKYHRKSL